MPPGIQPVEQSETDAMKQRDAEVARWQKQHPDKDVFEDRRLDLPSRIEISVDEQMRAVQGALDARR